MARVAIIHCIPIHYKHLLFSELVRQGLDFEVLFFASRSTDRIESPDLSTASYRSRVGFQGWYEALPKWRSAWYVWRSLNSIQPRTVIIPGWADIGAWTAKFWCALHRRASILWAETNEWDHPRVDWKERIKAIFLRGFSCAQVYGASNLEYLVKLGVEPGRIWVRRAVADTELFRIREKPWPRQDSRRAILFVGRLAQEKNLEFVLDALQLLSPGTRETLLFRFVGYGPLEASLRLKAESLSLNEMIEFAGPRVHSQLPEVYHAADVILLPSTSEPWGLTVNEGMLCGLPAIVSDRCGCARDLVNHGTGWSFSPDNAAAFVQILEKVATMALDDLRAMGKNAAVLAAEYSAQNCARSVMECVSAAEAVAGERR
jgi:1,2-diacylglycerol 3-alpha-glucosyltransferase